MDIVTRLRAERAGVQISDFSLLQTSVCTLDAHPASYSLDTGVLSREYSDHLISSLRMIGAIPVLPLYVFMTWTGYLQPVYMRPLLAVQRKTCIMYSLEQHQQRSGEWPQ